MSLLTKQNLIDFEEDIATCFNNKQIKAPIHLYFGNEDEMIKVFKDVKQEDWVLCSWRSHYQCLLKGVHPSVLKKEILQGHSISLCFPEYRILSSAIVTGILPIAVGLGLAIKRSGGKERVFVWVGDMTSETGQMWECFKYVLTHDLPVKFIVEDNKKSVCTDTRKTCLADEQATLQFEHFYNTNLSDKHLYYYKYETKWPHAGSGSRIQF